MIVLVRHASTDWSGVRYCGLADPPLSDAGRREATETADRVAALVEPGVRIVSSPRQRALDTARVIARATVARGSAIDERWQEVDVGEAEGLTFDEIDARWPDLAAQLAAGASEVAWPGGEPAGALTARVREAWSELDNAEGTTVIVTHGGPIGVVLDLALGAGNGRPFLHPGGVRGAPARGDSVGRSSPAPESSRQRPEKAAAASAAIASTVASASPFASVTPVAPNPMIGSSPARVDTAASVVARVRPSGSGIVTAQPPARIEAVHVERDVDPVDARSRPRAPTPRAPRAPTAVASIPAPKWATCDAASVRDSASSSTCPPSSAACSSSDRRAVAGLDEIRVAPAADHRERHAPDVARRRRVGRVEVAVGVEPGDRERRPAGRAAAVRPSPRHGRCSRHRGPAAARRRGAAEGCADGVAPRAAGTRRSGRGSSPAGRRPARKPGSIGTSPASRIGTSASPGSAAKRSSRPRSRSPPALLHAGEVAAEGGRDADDDDRAVGRTADIVAADLRAIIGPMRIADFALERFFARWEFAVEYLLCASDVEGWPMADLLELADDETARDVARPPARLHGVDRPSAAPRRDRRAVRHARRRTTSSSSPAPRRRSSASRRARSGRATTPS